MSIDIAAWLGRLPEAHSPDHPEGIVIEGLLLRGDAGRILILIDGLCLEFDAAEVMAVEETHHDPAPPFGIHAILTLKHGARLWRLSSGAPLAGLQAGQQPFCVSTRSDTRHVRISASYRAREQAFIDQLDADEA